MFEIFNESIDQPINTIAFSIINISVTAKLTVELFQIAFNNFVMLIFEQFESSQFIFSNSKTSAFKQSDFDNYALKSQLRIDTSRVKKNFEIALKFHTHISRRFNSVRSNSKNFFSNSHRYRSVNEFTRQKRLYIDRQHIDRQRNKQQKQIIQHLIQHLMNNSNYTNLSIKNPFLSKHQSTHSNKFDKLKYLRSKIRELKRSSQSDEHQSRLFFKNDRLNEISQHYRKIKTISNSSHSFNSSRQNRYSQDYQQPILKYQQVDHRQSNDQLMFSRAFRALRSQNIMMYNFIKHSIDFFIRRFKQIAKIEKSYSMLRVLFFCLKNDALK